MQNWRLQQHINTDNHAVVCTLEAASIKAKLLLTVPKSEPDICMNMLLLTVPKPEHYLCRYAFQHTHIIIRIEISTSKTYRTDIKIHRDSHKEIRA